ncbi:MAG: GIY-YIG nuclease family protein [Bacteroidota bacterium]
MYFTYILKSTINNRYYYGHTKDLQARLKAHNAGKVRSTKAFRPWEIHYVEQWQSKAEAYRRELFFKSIDGYNFLKDNGIT